MSTEELHEIKARWGRLTGSDAALLLVALETTIQRAEAAETALRAALGSRQ